MGTKTTGRPKTFPSRLCLPARKAKKVDSWRLKLKVTLLFTHKGSCKREDISPSDQIYSLQLKFVIVSGEGTIVYAAPDQICRVRVNKATVENLAGLIDPSDL